jgi:hypothetical protein
VKDSEIEWFRPLWLRVVITVAIALWCAYEVFISRDGLWIAITCAALAYAVWNLFIRYDARAAAVNKPADGNGDGKPEA